MNEQFMRVTHSGSQSQSRKNKTKTNYKSSKAFLAKNKKTKK